MKTVISMSFDSSERKRNIILISTRTKKKNYTKLIEFSKRKRFIPHGCVMCINDYSRAINEHKNKKQNLIAHTYIGLHNTRVHLFRCKYEMVN